MTAVQFPLRHGRAVTFSNYFNTSCLASGVRLQLSLREVEVFTSHAAAAFWSKEAEG